MFGSGNIFCPQIALDAGYHLALSLRQVFARHIAVYFLQRQIAAYSFGLRERSVLIGVEIAVGTRREHHVVAVLDSLVRLLESAPYHDGSVAC